MNQPPPKPWSLGRQSTYSAFRLVVNICQDNDGNVWSDHDFTTPADQQLSLSLPHGGAPQVAHALLTEAVRREAFMCALIEQMKNEDYLAHWEDSDTLGRARIEADLGRVVAEVITRTLGKMAPGVVAGILTMMADQK